MSTLGLITAIPEELAEIGPYFEQKSETEINGIPFRQGTLNGRNAVVVETGVGKVNAAMTTTLLCDHFKVGGILFSGVAGGLDPALEVGDVVIGEHLIMHDYGAVIDGRIKVYQPGNLPLPGFPDEYGFTLPAEKRQAIKAALADITLPTLVETVTGQADRTPSLRFGTILTGDAFVNCEATRQDLHSRFDAQAVEMEGAAIAQVAYRYGLQPVVVRALSDLAGQESNLDFGAFVKVAAKIAATLVVKLAPVA